jgi:hypothetical protein
VKPVPPAAAEAGLKLVMVGAGGFGVHDPLAIQPLFSPLAPEAWRYTFCDPTTVAEKARETLSVRLLPDVLTELELALSVHCEFDAVTVPTVIEFCGRRLVTAPLNASVSTLVFPGNSQPVPASFRRYSWLLDGS